MKIKNGLAIIGGSGIYDIEGLKNPKWIKVESSFGEPSDELLFGKINGRDIVFLPRHGRGHKIPPSDINYRANIEILKKVGVKKIISFGAVGSFKESLSPGTFVLIDQFFDRTINRKKSFFGPGLAAHVQFAHPICSKMKNMLLKASNNIKINIVEDGTYLAMEGPQFSTLAESNIYRSWGCDVIGMTNMPEAKLAREAEICYATVAMVTDYDCWHPDHETVSVTEIIRVLSENSMNAKNLLKSTIPLLSQEDEDLNCTCNEALENAIITAPEARDPEMVNKLKYIAGRVL
jgi:5'-methylthioadenosine phosphorylase